MNVVYREFKSADGDTVAELIKSLYREDPEGKPMTDEKIRKTIDELTRHPDKGTILVLDLDGEIIGYAILLNIWSNEFGGNIVNIDELYVKEEFRRKGIATNFIKHLATSKFGNAVALSIETTPGNKKARALYEKIGFKQNKNDLLILDI